MLKMSYKSGKSERVYTGPLSIKPMYDFLWTEGVGYPFRDPVTAGLARNRMCELLDLWPRTYNVLGGVYKQGKKEKSI